MKTIFRLLYLAVILLVSCRQEKPVIGITGATYNERVTVREEYTNAVSRAGGIPVVLPMCSDEDKVREMVEAIDGIIISGGEDINPAYFGEDVLNGTVEIYGKRDTSDFLMLDAALKRGIPILGICRGAQLVNVYYGGTLYQDLPVQTDTQVIHKQYLARNAAQHQIYMEKDSELFHLLGTDSAGVNSFHHQAIKDLGKGLKISARSADGVIEGIEGNGTFCVQFHPEAFVSAGDNTFLPLFEAFIEKAGN